MMQWHMALLGIGIAFLAVGLEVLSERIKRKFAAGDRQTQESK